jgi:hypothetical protein
MAYRNSPTSAHTTEGASFGSLAPFALIGVLAFGGVQLFELNRDLDSIQDRGQIAANREDMLGYLRTLSENMVKHAATSGHTALLLKTPANDLALHFQALNSVIGRLEQIQDLPADSAAYQTALDDLRGVLREMPRIASGVFWVQHGWWMAIVAVVCFAIINSD